MNPLNILSEIETYTNNDYYMPTIYLVFPHQLTTASTVSKLTINYFAKALSTYFIFVI